MAVVIKTLGGSSKVVIWGRRVFITYISNCDTGSNGHYAPFPTPLPHQISLPITVVSLPHIQQVADRMILSVAVSQSFLSRRMTKTFPARASNSYHHLLIR